MQYAAIEAYARHDDVEHFIDQSRLIHKMVNTYIATSLRRLGFDCPTPTGAFYTWPEISLGNNTSLPYKTSSELADHLLEQHGVVTLPGNAFGESDDVFRLRLSGCDYDGQTALDLLEKYGIDALPEHLFDLAPNVIRAMDQFALFADS